MNKYENYTDEAKTEGKGIFAIGGVSGFAESLAVAKNFVLRINICGKKPAYRISVGVFAFGTKFCFNCKCFFIALSIITLQIFQKSCLSQYVVSKS